MSDVPQRVGKYELQELLGRGGMAEVWKAFDTQLHRYVAIKLLHANLQTDPDFISRFTHEAQMVAALRHPNIIQIYDFHTSESVGSNETLAYMVMEHIKGQTLAHYINATSKQKQFPSASDIIRLFTPISLALDYAHQQGTIHRDIKPANILLDQKNRTRNPMGEPILSDFGLAKVMDAPSQTVAGFVLGTPLYISPEQVQNKPISNRTDLYSLGIVLYEIFASKPPFYGDSSSRIMLRRVTDEPTDPRTINVNLPSALAEVLLKSVAREPQNRFPTAATMICAMAKALDLPIPEDLRLAIASTYETQGTSIDTLSVDDEAATMVTATSADAPLQQQADAVVGDNVATVVRNDAATVDIPSVERVGDTGGPVHLPDSESLLPGATTSGTIITGKVSSSQQTIDSKATPPIVPPIPHALTTRKRQRMRIVIAALLIVVLIVAGSGTLFLRLTTHKTATITATNAAVGQALFLSDVNLTQDTARGNNSKLELDLKTIPAPQRGESYYAWLLPDKNQPEGAPILLGQLAVKNGNVHFVYAGNKNGSDLLASTSRFLITEESSAVTPDIPSPDLSAWRYYAELPQTVPANQKYSLLDHIRHLLANDPTLISLHLTGGLDLWAARNTYAVAQWSKSARNDWQAKNFDTLRQHIVSILDYLDGDTYVSQDVPAGTPLYDNHRYAQVGLLEFDPTQQNPPSYLYHIALHLNGVISSPGSTQYQRSVAVQVNIGINNMKVELGQSRQDAIQLVHMNNTQLAQPSALALLNDMVTQTNIAYAGQVDTTTQQVKKMGMTQIYQYNQRLATFEIKPYHN